MDISDSGTPRASGLEVACSILGIFSYCIIIIDHPITCISEVMLMYDIVNPRVRKHDYPTPAMILDGVTLTMRFCSGTVMSLSI